MHLARLATPLLIASVAAALFATRDRPNQGSGPPPWSDDESGLPAPTEPALDIRAPRALEAGDVSRYAPVHRSMAARTRPDSSARQVARLPERTPENTDNIVQVLDSQTVGPSHWVRVRLPSRRGDSTGWVPRRGLGGYTVVRTHLMIDLQRFEIRLERDGATIFSAHIGVGRADSPTPTGRFYVRNRLTEFSGAFYGPVAFGTSARAAVTEWPAGGFVGLHGTNRPDLIPGPVSHGCVRLRNADIVRLAALMPVGTPVTIR